MAIRRLFAGAVWLLPLNASGALKGGPVVGKQPEASELIEVVAALMTTNDH